MARNILIVDDSRIMRNIVKNTFLQMKIPCEFVEASDGDDALQKLFAQKIHLVLLDWNMPKLLGIDFLKKVRGMEQYKDLPIIMVTSESAKYNVIDAIDAGATDYIIKPINERVFLQKISQINI
ncbi:MAG: response regulator [Treponema sp.]|nr:response regulator [Treponema sp.]